ncbi:MAG: hypothetical protein V4649_04480 [Bacteroidota bacterium]
MHSITDTATIKLPSVAQVIKNGAVIAERKTTATQFKNGDKVVIKLGYNGELQTEFEGFVKGHSLDMPLQVDCEGYSWLLKREKVTLNKANAKLKDVLESIIETGGANGIKVASNDDITFSNLRFSDKTPFEILAELATYTDNSLTCFFSQPDTLWCGLAYSGSAAGKALTGNIGIKYILGYNTLKENTLVTRSTDNDRVQVKYSKKMPSGEIVVANSTVKDPARVHSQVLNSIADKEALEKLAAEKALQFNYGGLEGKFTAFLQPYAGPGDSVAIADSRYPEIDGEYLVESTQVTFGVKGARRIIDLGPKLVSTKK